MRLTTQWMWEGAAADVRQRLARQLRALNLQFAWCTSPAPGAHACENALRTSFLHEGTAKNTLFDQSTASVCDLEENGFFPPFFPSLEVKHSATHH